MDLAIGGVFRLSSNPLGKVKTMDDEMIQRLINTGMAWQMEGSIGRDCMRAIEAGRAMCGTESRRNYWGNVVPSRYDVKPGTKGSFDYVVERMGMDHAQAMADVDDDLMHAPFAAKYAYDGED